MCATPTFTVVDRCRYCGGDLPAGRVRAVEYADHMSACESAPQHVREAMQQHRGR